MNNTKNNRWVSLLKVVAIIGVIVFMMDQCFKSNREQSEYEANDPKGRIERHFSKYDGSYTKFRNYIRDNLNNPKSFEHVETRYTDNNDGTVDVIMKYRGQNGFGAIITKYAKCVLNTSTGDFSDVVVE